MNTRTVDCIYHGLSFLAVISVLSPLMMLFFFFLIGDSVLWSVFLSALFFLSGYGMQVLYAKMAGAYRYRNRYESGTGSGRRFTVAASAGPVAVSLLLSFFASCLFEYLFRLRYEAGLTDAYNLDSPLPFLGAVGMFLALLSGIVLWFYPPERLASVRVVVTAVVLFFIAGLFFGGSTLIVGSLVVFSVCMVLILNQSHISRSFRGSVVCVLTGEARLYNTKLTLLFLGSMLLVAFGLAVVFGGLWSVLRGALYVFLYNVLRAEESKEVQQYYDAELAAGEFRRAVYGGSAFLEIASYIVLALMAVLLLWMITRKQNVVKTLLERIRRWIEDVIAFWTMAGEMFKLEKPEILNYKDERKKIQRAAVRDYHEMAENTDTYANYTSRLEKLPTMDEKIGYAYRMLIRVCRSRNIPIKLSDTPREAKAKIHRADIADVDSITDVLELVKYAQKDPGEQGDLCIRSISEIVKKYLA